MSARQLVSVPSLIGLAALIASVAGPGPQPLPSELAGFAATFAAAPDSSLQLGTAVYARNVAPTDTVLYRYFRNDTALVTRRSVRMADSVQVPAPAYGVTARYKGCAQIERGGRTAPPGEKFPPVAVCWTWTYARPLPAPAIDSVRRISLRAVPLVPGGPFTLRPGAPPTDSQRVQYCALVERQSGARELAANSAGVPVCDSVFQVWLQERRT